MCALCSSGFRATKCCLAISCSSERRGESLGRSAEICYAEHYYVFGLTFLDVITDIHSDAFDILGIKGSAQIKAAGYPNLMAPSCSVVCHFHLPLPILCLLTLLLLFLLLSPLCPPPPPTI